MAYDLLDIWEQTSMTVLWNSIIFVQEIAFDNVTCKMAVIVSQSRFIKHVMCKILISAFHTGLFLVEPLFAEVIFLGITVILSSCLVLP